jgi:hypothetical protein
MFVKPKAYRGELEKYKICNNMKIYRVLVNNMKTLKAEKNAKMLR